MSWKGRCVMSERVKFIELVTYLKDSYSRAILNKYKDLRTTW